MSTPGDAGTPAQFVDFETGQAFSAKGEYNEHISRGKRPHTVHGPCEVCGTQLHYAGDQLRANKKTGVPKLFCDTCKADIVADLGGSP